MTESQKIAFQGEPGAYSHMACRQAHPELEPMACKTFEETIEACRSGAARLAMLPVENSTYGRVADIHSLLPGSGLYIIAETFVPVAIQLMGPKGARLEGVEEAQSHTVLGQCREFLRRRGIRAVVGADTAGSAAQVAAEGDPRRAALASELAAETTGWRSWRATCTTTPITRPGPGDVAPEDRGGAGRREGADHVRVRGEEPSAALYKAMGGFATNGINMVKLESYMTDGSFTATQFLADIEGHPEEQRVRWAMEELGHFTNFRRVLGVYPAHPYRETAGG